jgi:serine/threonine protein phosphatase 1
MITSSFLMEVIMQFKPRKQHIYNGFNEVGRDFVVGDLHGQIKQLLKQLSLLNFNFTCDRLFCTGDIIGKGSDSIDCLNLLTKKWFYSVMGNHEQLFLMGFKSLKYWDLLKLKEGRWLSDNLENFDLLIRWKTLIEIAMPLTRTIKIKGFTIGISHASATNDWAKLQAGILSDDDIWQTLWSRPLRQKSCCLAINSVDYVVHGHTPVPNVIKINNRFWIDTYSTSQSFTVINLNELPQTKLFYKPNSVKSTNKN